MTRVSIVVPAYNNADHIEETLHSIVSQTHADLEIIVADHSSTDGTRAVVERFADDPRLTIVDTPSGGGAPRNWDRVTQLATGDFIKLVCGDDLLDPTIVERQVAVLSEDDRVALTSVRRSIVDAESRPVIRARGLGGALNGRVPGTQAIRATVRAGSNLLGEPACVMMRRDALEAAGFWDPRFPYLIDEATYARVLLTGDFVGIPEPLASFRISQSQWSVALTKQQYEQAAGFHRWMHDTRPDVVSRSDLAVGNALARANASGRRLTYVALQRRMSKSA
ncbi:glycosyltransferase family 2 protein [Agromyces sp. MMS24-K17]|uniref:glycosyltransferase family 2 protein n=1 Tax=Agromyces sp. MMS24-K17 TaxID=3372850 RepID=UPI003753F574